MTIENLEKYIMEKVKVIPLSKIKAADWNYKKDDEIAADKLLHSLMEKKQIQWLNVRKLSDDTYEVGDGNHRLIALQEIGYEGAICLDHGDISVEELIEISAVLNENYFKIDNSKFSVMLNEFDVDLEQLSRITLFDIKELQELKSLKAPKVNQQSNGGISGSNEPKEEWIEIIVKAPKIEADIFYSELERIKKIAETDSDWVALKFICVNSSQTPEESLQ